MLEKLRILGDVRVDHFQRDPTVLFPIRRQVNGRHAAPGDGAHDFVVSKLRLRLCCRLRHFLTRSVQIRVAHTSLPLARDLRLRRTGDRLAHGARPLAWSPRSLSLPRRAPPPPWETSRAATQTVTGVGESGRVSALRYFLRIDARPAL